MAAIAIVAFVCGLLLGLLLGGAWEFCRSGGTYDLLRAQSAARRPRRLSATPPTRRHQRRRSA